MSTNVRCRRLSARGVPMESHAQTHIATWFVGSVRTVVGEAFAADLFDLKTGDATVTLSVPQDAQGQAMDCPELVYPAATTRRLRSAPLDADAATWYLQATADAVRERRLASGKKCVFMHGLGHADNKPSGSTHTDYWGDVHNWAECSSFTFIKRDTKNVAFDDPALLSHFCTEVGLFSRFGLPVCAASGSPTRFACRLAARPFPTPSSSPTAWARSSQLPPCKPAHASLPAPRVGTRWKGLSLAPRPPTSLPPCAPTAPLGGWLT